jgi:hypothetical protein
MWIYREHELTHINLKLASKLAAAQGGAAAVANYSASAQYPPQGGQQQAGAQQQYVSQFHPLRLPTSCARHGMRHPCYVNLALECKLSHC